MASETDWLTKYPEAKQESWLDKYPEATEKPFFDLSDTLSATGRAFTSLGTSVPASMRQAFGGLENPWQRSEGYAQSRADMQALQQELEASDAAAMEGGDASSVSSSIREATPSLGFSGSTLVPSLAAGAVTALATKSPAAARSAAAGTSLLMAYRMAGAQFLDDSRERIDNFFQEKLQRPLTPEEQNEAYEELLPLARKFGAAEAGPEALGNMALGGAGKYIRKALGGKNGIMSLASNALSKVTGAKAVGAGVGAAAGEVGTEAITAVEQDRINKEFEQSVLRGEAPESVVLPDRTVQDYTQGITDVAPTTLAMTGLMGLAGLGPTAINRGYQALRPQAEQQVVETDITPEEPAPAPAPTSPDGVVTTLPFNREDIRATDLPFNREDIKASELPFTREDIRPTQLPFNREDIRSTELPFSRQNIRGLSQLGQPAISPGLTAAVNTADSIVTTAENTSSDVSQATTAARNIIQGVVDTPQPREAPTELPAVTPSPAMEQTENLSQTITDSNGEIAPEMSVLPPTVQAGAGVGEAIAEDGQLEPSTSIEDQKEALKDIIALKKGRGQDVAELESKLQSLGADTIPDFVEVNPETPLHPFTSEKPLLPIKVEVSDAGVRSIDSSVKQIEKLRKSLNGKLARASGANKFSIESDIYAVDKALQELGRVGREIESYLKPITPQGTPTPATEGTVMPRGSATPPSRGRPVERVVFEKPIKTPIGEIVSYDWQHKVEEVPDKEGEMGLRRFSDWDQAEKNADTGRDIVHQFTVRKPDGTTQLVSLESALGKIPVTAAKGFKAAIKAARRLPVYEAELARLELQQKNRIEAENKARKEGWKNSPPIELRDSGFPAAMAAGARMAWIGDNEVALVDKRDISEDGTRINSAIKSQEIKTEWAMGQIKTPSLSYGEQTRIDNLRRSIKRDKATLKENEITQIQSSSESAQGPQVVRGVSPSNLGENDTAQESPQTTTVATPTETAAPLAKEEAVASVVQQPAEGSIPAVEQKSATTAIESNEKADIADAAMAFLEEDLTESKRQWSPEKIAAAKAYFASGGKDMNVLRAAFPKLVGSRPIVQAYLKADKEASEAQAKRDAADAKLAKEIERDEKEQAKLEADQKQREELGLKTLNSLIEKTRTNVVQGTVKSSDANQAVAILNKSGAIPNVLFTWIGTSKDFLADPANRARYPETWRAVSNNNNAEGWSENGQPIVFTNNVGVSDLDRNLAKLQGTTPEVAAVRRVILHENIHKGMFFLNRKDKMKLFEFLHRLYSPEELDRLAKSYDEYSDWRINQDSYFSIIEEAMTRDFDSMAEIPRDGIWAEFMQFLRDIWQKITGKTSEPTLKNYKDVFRLIRNSLKNSEAANADRLKNGGATMMSMSEFISNVTPEQDAAYAKAVADGDMATAQRMVDAAAKGKGPFYHRSGAKEIKEFYPWTNFGTEEQAAAVDLTGRNDGTSRTYKVFLDILNPLRVEDQGMGASNVMSQAMDQGVISSKEYATFPFNEGDDIERAFVIKLLQSKGYDGLVYSNEWEGEGDSFITFTPNQIKSADPVTYDDAGNVIPLSRRFQSASNDIRFSKVEYDSPNEAAFNSGAEVARNADYDERDKAVRSTIRAAYDLAPKNNGPSVPLDQLFDIAKQSMPDLTENEFSQILQDLYEDSGALLQAGESPFIVTTPDGQRAGSAIIVSSLPTGAMASAIDPEDDATKKFVKDIQSIESGTLKAAFEGRQFKDFMPIDRTIKPNKSYEQASIDYVNSFLAEGGTLEQMANSVIAPNFLAGIGIEDDVMARQALVAEVRNRIVNAGRKKKSKVEKKFFERLNQRISAFWQGVGTKGGRNQGQRAYIIGNPRYSWMFLTDEVDKELKQRRDNILNVQFGNDNATSFTQNSYENADKANQMAVDNVASEAEFTQEADSDADLLRDGEATLDAKQKTIWEKVKDAIRTKALIAKALEAMRARKAGNKAKASISEEARNAIFQMTEEELLALDAKMDKVIADGAKTFLGEESAADTQEKKTVRKKREKMVEVTKKRAEKGLTLESLDSDSALSKMLREINQARRGAEVPLKNPIPWRKLLSQKVKTVEEYRQRIFDAISANEELKSATPEQKARLADLFTEAWESNRKRILDGMQERLIREKEAKGDLSKKGAEALQEQRMRMVEDINLGIFDNDEIAKIMAEKFGIKSEFTDAEREKIESLIEVLQDEKLNRVKRNKAAYELLETLSAQTDIPISKLLANFWVSSVLSGMNTVFSIGMSVFSGMGELTTTLYRIFVSAFSNPKQLPSEVAAAFKTLARVLSAAPRQANRAWQYLVTGDQAFLDPTMNDALKNMDWDSIGKNTQLAEQMAKSDNTLQKVMGLFMRTVSRLLTALDLFNSGLTKEGSLSLVFRQLNLDPSKIEMLEKKSELKAYKAQVIRDYFNNVQPKTLNEKALVESYAMAEMMKELDELGSVSENADQMAMQGAMTLDPSGIGGYGYRLVKSMMKSAESGADKLVERNLRKWDEAQGASDKTEAGLKLALSYIFQFAAYNAANLVGVRFARFAGNKFNQSLSFLPIIGALRLYEAEFDADRIRGKEAFTDMIKRNQLTGVMAAAIGYVFLKAIAEEPDDEKRGWFINGGWSNLTPEKKQQKLASGQKEYTLGFGDTVINYGNWPGSGIIAAIGGLSDLIRFSPEQWSEKTVSNKLMSATASGVFSALEVPALSQFQELFGSSLSSKDPNEQKLTKFARVIGNYAGGFVPRILKDIDYLADPNFRKYETLWEKTASHIPIYRRYEGKEYYDILGQQIQRNVYPGSREFMTKPTDPAYKVLGALNSRGIWLTPANAEHRMVGKGARRRSLTQEEADNYSLETGKGYKQMLLRYGQRALQMPTERAKAFLLDKADDVRDRALKKVYRGYTPAS